ncbi:glycoprotein 3 [Klebsiella pneumoniae]|uniref:glycoprotein 3 n=1 Tax=Klebsiella pneumoniae TaxID=573 RepID=UPI003EE42277
MTDTPFIPDYLKPALERLAAARAAHLEQARRMEDTLAAITRVEEQKAELEQDNGSDTRTWRAAFRAGGAMLTDELKSGHIERVARRELAQECDNLTEVLAFERDQLKVACNSTARAFRQAHHAVLSEYAKEELDRANTIGHQGYTEPEKEVMHQVVTFLTGKVSAFSVTPADEPVLSLTGFPAVELAHMDHDAASTPGERKVWQEKMRQREADLKARGLLP